MHRYPVPKVATLLVCEELCQGFPICNHWSACNIQLKNTFIEISTVSACKEKLEKNCKYDYLMIFKASTQRVSVTFPITVLWLCIIKGFFPEKTQSLSFLQDPEAHSSYICI